MMILKGNQRAGGRKMALHLLNVEQNEHVNVHEVRGFVADNVLGALNEAYALSKGTKCTQFMYSLSLNPPLNESVSIETFEKTLERVEKKLGLVDQPRVVVFHEKEGRRHAHAVWSRINIDEMKAINISHPKLKLNDISKSLYLEHGWKMPDGFRDKTKKNPLNYTRAEWQQALRINRKPADIKRELLESWAVSDSKQSFETALQEQGYYLARGDRRGYVAVDVHGEVYSLSRQLGRNKKELAARLGKESTLPSVSDVKTNIHGKLSKLFKHYTDELTHQQKQQANPLRVTKHDMIKEQREIRAKLDAFQKERWQSEENKRNSNIRKGFKGLFDKINGRYWKTRKRNERETWQCRVRDQKQLEELINTQLGERQNLQVKINLLQETQEKERGALIRDLSHIKNNELSKDRNSERDQDHQNEIGFDYPDLDIDFEPEI